MAVGWARHRGRTVLHLALLALGCAPTDYASAEHPQRGDHDRPADSAGVLDDTGSHADDEPAEDTGDPPLDEDAAVIVTSDLPTALACADTTTGSVTVRNTGSATWTRDAGYKLGAVDDEDPFYSSDTRVWLPDGVAVPTGDSYTFEFPLVGPDAPATYTTDWRMVHEGVHWFGETVSASVVVECAGGSVVDPLTEAALQDGFADKQISGGSFTADGWQTTGAYDQLVLVLDTAIHGAGSLEIDVRNFDPTTQYSSDKHQIINLYTSEDGSQAVFDTDEAWWNIRTGMNYGTGVKLLAAAMGGDSREEVRLIASASWDPSDVYTWRVDWDDSAVRVSLDGTELDSLGFSGRTQPLTTVFLGRDNVYEGQVGPIYSNLRVSWEP